MKKYELEANDINIHNSLRICFFIKKMIAVNKSWELVYKNLCQVSKAKKEKILNLKACIQLAII